MSQPSEMLPPSSLPDQTPHETVRSHQLQKFAIDLGLWTLAAVLAYLYRKPSALTGGLSSTALSEGVLAYFLLSALIMGALSSYYGLYRQTWRRIGVPDLLLLLRAVVLATVLGLAAAFLLYGFLDLPRSVPLLTGGLGLLLLSGVRLLARVLHERVPRGSRTDQRRVLIVGAGDAGSLIAREMLRHPEAQLHPVGFVDDDPDKRGTSLVGLPVFGGVSSLPEVVRREGVEEILIAVPSAAGTFVRRVVDLAKDTGVSYRIIPGVFEILSGNVSLGQIRDVNLEDLLRRPPVQLNTAEIAGYLRDRTVLVTGAGGSIGSEIVRQILQFGPGRIVLMGRGEGSIFAVQQELRRLAPELPQVALIGDVRDRDRVEQVFRETRPQVVFHAAAHKHVPLMEAAPSEAILNNVIGTRNVVEMGLKYGVERLVNVSTDKAVNPTSVMGASKRMAEKTVSAGAARAKPGQAFVSVRFGNVLGSRGSVVPTFMHQIRQGGPVTVTHPEMTRYFMTIPEAARLVLQAGGLAENGKVYVLNMGNPVNISDLARDVIRLSGAQDIEVVYSGVRPGEKLYEELLTSSEGTDATTHAEIFSARLEQVDPETLDRDIAGLEAAARSGDFGQIRSELARIIPENKFGSLG
ncbi:polysaccharide biosynthesis protein CapD [Deinococcus piscis]|uniref:Polysaccharide biosynthesis protein CapD n=1 Tax=Deinococcus piscis TaxID=394230 RepID=A0ABQ3K6P2_9DEIO|nr:nucleoside-diphosphate sugar epimerase/dehydratase [Deinococcus piscis]GHG05421.1 polysaccharide biosynthesis protein CapD [Deinococcus piscis]